MASLSFAIILLKSRYGLAAMVFIIAASFGATYYAYRLPSSSPGNIEYYNDSKVEIIGRVQTEVDRRTTGQTIVLSVTNALAPVHREMRGRVLLKLPLYPEIAYGEIMRVTCQLEKPEPFNDFAYDRYLAVAHIYTICNWPKIIERRSQNEISFSGTVLAVKKKFLNRLNAIMPEPQASLLAGLLVGSRQGIPDDINEDFKRTGLSHIIAISGYNITIIATCILGMTKRLIGRKRSFWFVVGVLGVFVILTGAQASVVRAAVMGITVLLSRYLGRQTDLSVIILLAAGVMVLINPLVLAFDIGFQLSFLATIGLVYLSQKMDRFFGWVPESFSMRESVRSTLSATIMTLPLLIYYFGRVSIISPLANCIILPIIPLVMATGFIAVVVGLIWNQLGLWLSVFPWFGLDYMIRAIRLLAQFRYASMESIQIPPSMVWFAYGFIIIGALLKCFRTKNKRI